MKYPADSILLIITRQLGDVLLTTPLLRSLRQAYPQARIDVLVYQGKCGLLSGNPDVNHIIRVAEHPGIKQYAALLKQILWRYDLAVSTLPGDRPLAYALLAARKRVAVVPPKRWQDGWKRYLSHAWAEMDNWNTHTVIQNLRLADLLEIPRHYLVVPPLCADFSKLNRLIPLAWHEQAFAVFHPTPMWHYKRWHIKGWAEAAAYLAQKHIPVLLTGGGDTREGEYLQEIMQHMPSGTLNLAGQLNFGEVSALLRHCRVYLGPDTAVTHLAAACNAPTVALYGPTNPIKWSPWPCNYAQDANPFEAKKPQQRCGNVVLLQGPGECVPCHQEGCDRHRQSASRCLDRLEPKRVIEAFESLLDKV